MIAATPPPAAVAIEHALAAYPVQAVVRIPTQDGRVYLCRQIYRTPPASDTLNVPRFWLSCVLTRKAGPKS